MQTYHGKLSKTEECRICPEESSTYKENFHTFPHSKQGKTPHSTNEFNYIFNNMNKKYVIERIVRIQWMFMNVLDENVFILNEYSWILQLIYMNWNFVLKNPYIYSNPFPKQNYFIKLKHKWMHKINIYMYI